MFTRARRSGEWIGGLEWSWQDMDFSGASLLNGSGFRLGYKGLGEPLCFLAFGPFSTLANYLAMTPYGATLASITPTAWGCSAAVGLTSTIVLFCSHFHQHDGDKLAGKLSPVVRLGGIDPAIKVSQFSFLRIIHCFTLFPFSAHVHVHASDGEELLVCCSGASMGVVWSLFVAGNHGTARIFTLGSSSWDNSSRNVESHGPQFICI